MIKITALPKETLVELLLFLAENESFPCVERDLKGSISVDDAKQAVRELAMALAREEQGERDTSVSSMLKEAGLTPKARKIVSALSSREERALLDAFGFIRG
ncbi:MAG TPA: hypothetical protein PKU96_06910 [bacterium]|nr:hypothetical protein [Myxococcales bacterium]OQA61782.1 MAG: hypothetical protein BWY40_00449 [bacterium ADurb.Bin270]HPW46076.1 hypothetical protein [bacterium]